MQIKLHGAGGDTPRHVTVPCTAPLGAHLAAAVGRAVEGKELWGKLASGKLARVDPKRTPADYGHEADSAVWTLNVRAPPIAASATAALSDEYVMVNVDTGERSPLRDVPQNAVAGEEEKKDAARAANGKGGASPAVGSPGAAWVRDEAAIRRQTKTAALSLPKKVYRGRLAEPAAKNQTLRTLTHYGYAVNDWHFSRDFSRSVLSEVVQLHLRGNLTMRAPFTPKGYGVPKADTHGGLSCWVTGEHHSFVRKWLRLLDCLVRAVPGLDVGERSPALVSCYAAGGEALPMRVDAARDERRMLTATMFLQANPGSGGDLHLVTQRNDVTIAPLLGRVLLMWSDARCPYETQYTITAWYYHRTPGYVPQPMPVTPRVLSPRGVGASPAPASVPAAVPPQQSASPGDKKKKKRKKKKKNKGGTAEGPSPRSPPNVDEHTAAATAAAAGAVRAEPPAASATAVLRRNPLFDADTTDTESDYSASESEDNWLIFCCALRAALASSLAVGVVSTRSFGAAVVPPVVPVIPLAQVVPPPRHEMPAPERALTPMLQAVASLGATRAAYTREARALRRVQAAMAAHQAAVQDLFEDALGDMHDVVEATLAFVTECGLRNV